MTVVLNEKEHDRQKRSYFSHKQVVATAATVVSAREPKTYSTMAHFRKKWISFKDEFHSDEGKSLNNNNNSSSKMNWKIWKKRTKTSKIPTPPTQQALFNFNLPIVISSTHNYYNNKQTEEGRKHYYLQSTTDEPQPAHSIVQKLTIVPSFNANLFLIVVLVALLVIAFGILQIHRTISILNTGIDLIRHTLTTSVSVTRTLLTSIMSLFSK